MGEIVQIHVGQAGVQIANACWELYCLEHGIRADGYLCECPCDTTFSNFFDFMHSKRVVPRAVLVDSEPTVIDQIRTGPYGHLYNPKSLITGKEDSGSSFARGYYTMGTELIDVTMDAIRNVTESCANLKGFLMFRSIGGGTGSGLGNLIAERVQEEYEKVAKLEFIIFPSPSMSPLIVEPYNALLATHLGMDAIDCSFILDNEALYDICASKLNITAPKYKNLNRIIGQTVSTFTTSQRFAGSSNVSFSEFQTNLVPYPRIHFPVVSYAPFISGTGSGYINFSTEQITNSSFDPSNQLVRCNPSEGKYMTSVLLYRGKVSTSDINASILQLRASKAIRFVDWSPTGFKVGMNTEPPCSLTGGGLGASDKALVTLSNNTIIQRAWCRLIGKVDRLYSRRAFIHHYIADGLEVDVLKEASEDICALISDYREVDKVGYTDRGKDGLTPMERKSERNDQEDGISINELSLPKLPGLQSLNFFFSDPEAETKPRDVVLEPSSTHSCEYGECEHKPSAVSTCIKSQETITGSSGICATENLCEAADAVPQINSKKMVCQRRDAEDEIKCSQVEKSKSFEAIRARDGTESDDRCEHSSKRSKSCDPKRCELSSPHPSKGAKNFDQGLHSEAVKAKERFSRSASRSIGQSISRGSSCGKSCSPGTVLKLPPPTTEGKEVLGEALSAKERFCNSTCQPRSKQQPKCSCQMTTNRKPSSSGPKIGQRISCIKCMYKPLRRNRRSDRQKCFCSQESDPLVFVNSDDMLLPMHCKHKRECQNPPDCFCDHDNDGRFDDSCEILVEPYSGCRQDEEIICLSDDRICDCFPECIAIRRPFLYSQPLLPTNRTTVSRDTDDEWTKPRFPGAPL